MQKRPAVLERKESTKAPDHCSEPTGSQGHQGGLQSDDLPPEGGAL